MSEQDIFSWDSSNVYFSLGLGKITMSDDFELGEDEMEPTSSVTFWTSLLMTGITEQASICVYKAYNFFFF